MKKIAFLFAGQGAQSAGMGKDLYGANAAAHALYDSGEALRPGTLQTCFEGPGDELTRTENAQPCLFLTDLAFAEALEEEGVHASFAAGFSLGEIPALAFTGVLSFADAFRFVTLRGESMAKAAIEHPGSMAAALKLDNETVESVCREFREIWPVNYNCPGQLSCAGSLDELDAFCERIKSVGGRAVRLAVSGAFHTPYLSGVTDILAGALEKMDVKAPRIPLYADLTGEPYPADAEGIRATVSRQVSSPVRWEKAVRAMKDAGVEAFVEVGPGKTLTGLVKKTFPDAETYTVNDVPSLEAAVAALKD